MIAFTEYSKIKDNLCLCYLGSCNEYLVQLKFIRPAIEKELPGINIYICCKDIASHLLDGEPRVIKASEIKDRKKELAYIKEINGSITNHAILNLIQESDLTLQCLPRIEPMEVTKKCVIYPDGVLPTKSLDANQLLKIQAICKSKGYTVEVKGSLNGAGWVVGVENEHLFEAAIKGIRTTLIPTGVGTELYKKLFPKGEVNFGNI
jgi:hypothetical protein